jgi:hypothetical protein
MSFAGQTAVTLLILRKPEKNDESQIFAISPDIPGRCGVSPQKGVCPRRFGL